MVFAVSAWVCDHYLSRRRINMAFQTNTDINPAKLRGAK
jgi:hypothetical protein